MKNLLLLFLIIIPQLLFSQKNNNWEISIISGYQIGLNKSNEEFFSIASKYDQGVHQIGFNLKKKIISKEKMSIQVGIGNSIERIASRIEVNHCYGFTNCFAVYISKRGYTVSLLEFPLNLNYSLISKLKLSLAIIPQFSFYRNETVNDSFSKFRFNMHSIESYAGLGYSFNKININLGYRLLNLKTIDPIFALGNDFIESQQNYYNQKIDLYNPAKFRLSFGIEIL